MSRPVFAIVGWVAATAAAVAVAHAGVSAVAGRVVEPLPPAVGLGVTSPTAPTTEPSTEPTPTPTPDVTSPSSPSATSSATDPAATPTSPGSAVVPTAPPPSPAAPDPEVRSYALVGGSATLRYEPGRVTVVAAEPAQGFSLEVEGDGTPEVTVEFESESHRSRLRGEWEDDGPEDRIEEDER